MMLFRLGPSRMNDRPLPCSNQTTEVRSFQKQPRTARDNHESALTTIPFKGNTLIRRGAAMSELTTTVSSVLKQKESEGILTISPNDSVYRAIELMAEAGVGALLVMDGNELVGIVSERDYARKVVLRGHSSKEMRVAEIMSNPVVTVSTKHTVGECLRLITDHRIRHLPVTHAGAVVGVLSIGDLVNCVISEQQETIRQLHAYISGVAS
jgi:CBS domain-containing protein